jgi:hypothetical protein
VPFDFLRRRKADEAGKAAGTASGAGSATSAGSGRGGRGVPFDGLTEEWRIVGVMEVPGRLSDSLNKREPISMRDVRWAPLDDSTELAPAPGLKTVDPYDLILVMAGEESLPPLSETERAALKVHKIAYDVALEAPPFRVVGTVYLYPGSDPDRLLDRSSEMFVPVVDATATVAGRTVAEGLDAILVNRFYLRGVDQIDKRTGERPPKLPGAPLGGISWQDKSR